MDEPMAYIGRCPECKHVIHVIFASADTPNNKEYLAKDVGDCIKSGLEIERMSFEGVRKATWGHDPQCKYKRR